MLRWSQKAEKTTNVSMEIVALTTKLSSLIQVLALLVCLCYHVHLFFLTNNLPFTELRLCLISDEPPAGVCS